MQVNGCLFFELLDDRFGVSLFKRQSQINNYKSSIKGLEGDARCSKGKTECAGL